MKPLKFGLKVVSYPNGNSHIIEASGEKITASKLEEGKTYLYKNFYNYRTIEEIEGNNVYYHDKYGSGYCTKATFVVACPTEATKEEIEFCDNLYF